MDEPQETEQARLKWYRKLLPNKNDPISLNLVPRANIASRTAPPDVLKLAQLQGVTETAKNLFPGNFFHFDFYLEFSLAGRVCRGEPVSPIRVASRDPDQPEVVCWGTSAKFLIADPPHPILQWIDDPNTGISRRKVSAVEDLLGAEGMLQKYHFRFERVLENGHNAVVYALLNPDTGTRLAYSFDRRCIESEALRQDSLVR